MKKFLIELGFAVGFGAILLFSLWLRNSFPMFANWRVELAGFMFCVFAVYMVITGDEQHPTRSCIYRMLVGIGTGIAIAILYKLTLEGVLICAIFGAILGLIGGFWATFL